MSFQEAKRESIKRYMLEKIRTDDAQYIQKTMENFDISVTTVKRYVKECLESGLIREDAAALTGYRLNFKEREFYYSCTEKPLAEDVIFFQDIYPELQGMSKEAMDIWSYIFMEMMNNAIEHSEGENITCRVRRDCLYSEIVILDDGVGIFRKVQRFLEKELGTEVAYQDVIIELYKGKLTTDSEAHSGEGIFFSSKMAAEFAIWSDGAVYSCGCDRGDQFVQSYLLNYYTRLKNIGTMVVMKLENQTRRRPKEVFDMFAPIEEGFVRTCIPVKEVCRYGEPIARSQARRLVYRLEEFRRVEFDFTGIEFMGQGFADEIFRVFQKKHPEIELVPVNANPSVLGMVKHVTLRMAEKG